MLPAYGGVTGWAALRWMGAPWLTGLAPDGRRRCRSSWPRPATTSGRSPGSRSAQSDSTRRSWWSSTGCGRRSPSGRCASRCGTPSPRALRSWRPTWRCRRTSCRSRRCATFVATQSAGGPASPRCREALVARRTRTAGRRARRATCGCVWVLDAGLPPPPVQRAGLRPIAAGTSARPTSSTRPRAWSGEYDGSLHLAGSPAGDATYAGRRSSASVGLEYFTGASQRTARTERPSYDGCGRVERAATFTAPSARAWTIVKPALVGAHGNRRAAARTHGGPA